MSTLPCLPVDGDRILPIRPITSSVLEAVRADDPAPSLTTQCRIGQPPIGCEQATGACMQPAATAGAWRNW